MTRRYRFPTKQQALEFDRALLAEIDEDWHGSVLVENAAGFEIRVTMSPIYYETDELARAHGGEPA